MKSAGLKIRPVTGRLISSETLGFSHVKILLSDQEFRSSESDTKGAFPTWRDEVMIYANKTQRIKVQVASESRVVGECGFSVESAVEKKAFEEVFGLLDEQGKNVGELRMDIETFEITGGERFSQPVSTYSERRPSPISGHTTTNSQETYKGVYAAADPKLAQFLSRPQVASTLMYTVYGQTHPESFPQSVSLPSQQGQYVPIQTDQYVQQTYNQVYQSGQSSYRQPQSGGLQPGRLGQIQTVPGTYPQAQNYSSLTQSLGLRPLDTRTTSQKSPTSQLYPDLFN